MVNETKQGHAQDDAIKRLRDTRNHQWDSACTIWSVSEIYHALGGVDNILLTSWSLLGSATDWLDVKHQLTYLLQQILRKMELNEMSLFMWKLGNYRSSKGLWLNTFVTTKGEWKDLCTDNNTMTGPQQQPSSAFYLDHDNCMIWFVVPFLLLLLLLLVVFLWCLWRCRSDGSQSSMRRVHIVHRL